MGRILQSSGHSFTLARVSSNYSAVKSLIVNRFILVVKGGGK